MKKDWKETWQLWFLLGSEIISLFSLLLYTSVSHTFYNEYVIFIIRKKANHKEKKNTFIALGSVWVCYVTQSTLKTVKGYTIRIIGAKTKEQKRGSSQN